MQQSIDSKTAWRLKNAARCLQDGGVVAHPTEGVWGLACDPLDPAAVLRVLWMKRRSLRQGLILIAHELEVLKPYLEPLDEDMLARVSVTWPGPVTWLLPAAPWLPDWISGGRSTVAVRVTAHPVASALCAAFGDALVSTSANRHGCPPSLTPTAVRARFATRLAALLPGDLQTPGHCSEIREGHSGKLLRP